MSSKGKTQVTLWLNERQVAMVSRIETARVKPRATVFKLLLEEEFARLETEPEHGAERDGEGETFWDRWKRLNPGRPLPE